MLALYIVAGIIVFLFLILLIPIDFTFNYSTGGEKHTSLRANWFFGLVWLNLRKRVRRKRREKDRTQSWRRFRQLGTDLKTLSALAKLARRLLHTLKVKNLSGYLQFGFDDPVHTGMAFGLVQPLFGCLSLPATASFRIEPDFSTPGLRTEVDGRVRMYPLKVVGTILGFVYSSDGRHVIKRLMRMRKH